MLTSDDRVWLLLVIRLAIKEIVSALDGNGEEAVREFRARYHRLMDGDDKEI